MQQAPSICCAILSWSRLPYRLRFPEAGLVTKRCLALTRHHSPHVHPHLYSLIKIRVFAAKCQAVFLSENSLSSWQQHESPSLWTRSTLCLGKKAALSSLCPVPSSSVPGLGLGQLGSVAGPFWPGSLGKCDAGRSSAIGNAFLNFSSLGVASARHNRSPWE